MLLPPRTLLRFAATAACIGGGLLLPPRPADAQQEPRAVRLGDTLRVRLAGYPRRVEGVVVSVGPDDSVRVQNRWWREVGGVPLQTTVAYSALRRADIQVRTESRFGAVSRNAVVGAAAGALAFNLVARMTLGGAGLPRRGFGRDVTEFGAASGALMGALSGLAAPREFWRPATTPSR